jgi:aminoglycoside phosphotransferase (APT) family kinase protein
VPRDPIVLTRELLGSAPDEIAPLVAWADRSAHRVTIGAEQFVVKSDDDRATVARESEGQQRADRAGVRVPEIVAVLDDAFAMRWVDGVTLADHPEPDAWRDTGAQIRLAHDLGSGGLPFGTGFGGFEPEQPTWREFFEVFAESMLRDCERDLDFPSDSATRVRDALVAAGPFLDAPHLAWCHGDFQPEHVIIDAATNRVAAIIDWADQGAGDVGWDMSVLTLDHRRQLEAVLDGYGAGGKLRVALDRLLPLYDAVRVIGAATWYAEHNLATAGILGQAIDLANAIATKQGRSA